MGADKIDPAACPFCGQPQDGREIIDIYDRYVEGLMLLTQQMIKEREPLVNKAKKRRKDAEEDGQ